MKVFLTFLTILSLSELCLAQHDSLSDVFPLAVGNRWYYTFKTSNYAMMRRYNILQTGTAMCQIIGFVPSGDSIVWQVMRKRTFLQYYEGTTIPGPPTTMSDSVTFSLQESLFGAHELRALPAQNLASDVWPLWHLYGDSSHFFRFSTTDSAGVRFLDLGWYYLPNTTRKISFRRDSGITSVSGWIGGGSSSDSWEYHLSAFYPSFPGPHLNTPRSITYNGLTGICSDTTVQLVSSGTDSLRITAIYGSDSLLTATVSKQTIAPVSEVLLTVRHRAPAAGGSDGKLFIISNSPTSPDTIDVHVQGGDAAILKIDIRAANFGNVFYSRRFLDTTVAIVNMGNIPLRFDTPIVRAYYWPWSSSLLEWSLSRMTLEYGDTAYCRLHFKMNSDIHEQYIDLLIPSNAPTSPDTIHLLGKVVGGMLRFSARQFSYSADVNGMGGGVLYLTHWGGGLNVHRTDPSNPAFRVPFNLPSQFTGWTATYADTIQFVPRAAGRYHDFLLYHSRSLEPGDDIPAVDTVWLSGTAGDVANITDDMPTAFMLEQNYPNPCNPRTTIPFDVPVRSRVLLSVYDPLGRLVASLVDGVFAPASYEMPFDAGGLSSGVYIYRMEGYPVESNSYQGGAHVLARKLVVLH